MDIGAGTVAALIGAARNPGVRGGSLPKRIPQTVSPGSPGCVMNAPGFLFVGAGRFGRHRAGTACRTWSLTIWYRFLPHRGWEHVRRWRNWQTQRLEQPPPERHAGSNPARRTRRICAQCRVVRRQQGGVVRSFPTWRIATAAAEQGGGSATPRNLPPSGRDAVAIGSGRGDNTGSRLSLGAREQRDYWNSAGVPGFPWRYRIYVAGSGPGRP